jgi:hypothetical protein
MGNDEGMQLVESRSVHDIAIDPGSESGIVHQCAWPQQASDQTAQVFVDNRSRPAKGVEQNGVSRLRPDALERH